jgi:hypothetical protein
MSVAKHTGNCAEKMLPVSFDVSLFGGRSAAIRIVDMSSSSNWGHINVDTFTFDWDIFGATIIGANGLNTTGGRTEVPRSGAAYVYFLQENTTSHELCRASDQSNCFWKQTRRLTASDKRLGAEFGTRVVINSTVGIIAVAAPLASLTGMYKDTPIVFPYTQVGDPYASPLYGLTTGNTAVAAMGIHFPISSDKMLSMESQPRYTPQRTGSYGVWKRHSELQSEAFASAITQTYPEIPAQQNTGAVYIFTRDARTFLPDGRIDSEESWRPVEHAKIQPPDAYAEDKFGSALAFGSLGLVVGSPGNDGNATDAGALYVFSLEFSALSFVHVSSASATHNIVI